MKLTCSTALRRGLGVAGFLIGFGLLSAGVASADEGDSHGLLGGVSDLLAPVTDTLVPVTDTVAPVTGKLAPVTRDVTAVVDPVVQPVLLAVKPVTEPVLAPLAPVVGTATQALGPVVKPLQPVTSPLLTPVVNTVRDVPVVPRIVDPLVARPSAPAEVPPAPVPAVPGTPQTPVVVPEVHAVASSGSVPVAVARTPQRQQIAAPDVAPPIEAPSPASPDVPFALPGMTGSASSTGSTGLAVSDLPARSGAHADDESLVVVTDHQVHGSWCYYYGRNHPS
ncbi:hypothetical protein [Lentzea sp.]|uniref:hypothetical protein n=1 Tax=Lentzea sp. TaxID=56099 RepID=UPI002ED4F591